MSNGLTQPPLRGEVGRGQDFPILSREVYGRPLVYLDNAATTQKPRCVVEAISEEYYNVNANVHRGVHYLSQQATELHEEARETVRRFINATDTAEVIFTRGTTESLNLLATAFEHLDCFVPRNDAKRQSVSPEVPKSQSPEVPKSRSLEILQTRFPSFPRSDNIQKAPLRRCHDPSLVHHKRRSHTSAVAPRSSCLLSAVAGFRAMTVEPKGCCRRSASLTIR